MITSDWLKSIGIYPDQRDNAPMKTEHSVRIEDGEGKESSDEDKDGDTITELVVVPNEDGSANCYIEEWVIPSLNTVGLVSLGERKTQEEILQLCRVLKAWAITYPE